jgi:hypothetical protein
MSIPLKVQIYDKRKKMLFIGSIQQLRFVNLADFYTNLKMTCLADTLSIANSPKLQKLL